MRIKWTTRYVDDQEKALQVYTDKLGFQKKADFTKGNYRWLTVASPEDPDGMELLLESNANPAGKAYQQALRGKGQPAAQFLVKDVQAEHDRLAAKGVNAVFTSHDITIRKLAERDHNVTHWKEYARGGHFPAMEVPAVLVDDVREFFKRFRR